MIRNTLLGIAAVVLVAAGCGGDDADDGVASIEDLSDTTTSTLAAPTAGDELVLDEEKVLAFSACMRDGGIEFPDPVVDSDGNVGFDLLAMRDLGEIDEAELQAAFEPCVEYLEGVNFGFERVFDTDFQDEVVVFAGCMRENGIDMPDPDFSGIMEGSPLFPGWEPEIDDPDFEAAFEACEELLPGIPGIAGG
ncbi:MAG: hypothetical protein GY720_12965 [bacterium]|nr:hypothetical protein [bacterium]